MGSVSAQNRKSCNTAIRSACPRRLRHTRRSSSAAVTGCAASPCSSGSAQPRAPACGRARAGCASGRGGRPRGARPSARATHGRRGSACGRVRPSETPDVFRKTVGAVVRRASAAVPVVVAVSIKSRTESEQNTASRGPMRRLRTRAEQRHPAHRRSGKAGHSVASANKRTCLGGSSGN